MSAHTEMSHLLYLTIDIMLMILNIKIYYDYHINFILSNKMRSSLYKTNEKYMYTLQVFNTLNTCIVDLLLIVS